MISSPSLFSRPTRTNPQSFPSPLPEGRIQLGEVSVGLTVAALLFAFLRFTKAGWSLRATSQDREAAQMGVDVNAVNATTYAIAGGFAGCW